MRTKRNVFLAALVIASLATAGLILSLPGPARWLRQNLMPMLPFSPDKQELAIGDFDTIHTPVNGDTNEYLIFGGLPILPPGADLAPELAVFLGRWEGYSYAPPVKKDWKFVLVIQEITAQGGKASLWMGTNLQYPSEVKEFTFSVIPGDPPSIKGDYEGKDIDGVFTFAYDPSKDLLQGWLETGPNTSTQGSIELSRDRSFYVYKDYGQYLAGKRIYPKTYQDSALSFLYGNGYLVYLPEGYESARPTQTWPLIIFLHGAGDRGDNVFLLAKASPFMMIREKGPLPFIIVAPLLSASKYYASFPDSYLNGMLEEILATYPVDQKRIYVTGLSIGGEATYRFALRQPDRFAAIVPLSAFLYSPMDMESIKDLPVWAIHGADDPVVPLTLAQKPVEALREVGNDVQFTILENHDHDVWTDAYTDPQFYDWLLQHERP